MEPIKKRKLDENENETQNGVASTNGDDVPNQLSREDVRKIIERLSTDQLLDILQHAVVSHEDVLDAVRGFADSDPKQRKLFIRGLGSETTSEVLRSLFSAYGELEEAIVIAEKTTGKSKGYGFVTFRHVDGAFLALKEPSKKIDSRMTVTQLASAGNTGTNPSTTADVSMRKIYVGNVPFDMPGDKLLSLFSSYGEIEEGPLGFDKLTGKSRGFALFVYKSPEGAQAAVAEPVKPIDGQNLHCKLAIEGKKGKPGAPPGQESRVGGDGMGMGMVPPPVGSYGGPGSYGGFSANGLPPMGHHVNSSAGMQAPSSLNSGGYGSATGYGNAGLGGPYSGYGSTGYSGMGSSGVAGGGVGSGSGLYRMPSSTMPGSGYTESGRYGSGQAYPLHHNQAVGTSPLPRVPPGGMYPPNVPPYY